MEEHQEPVQAGESPPSSPPPPPPPRGSVRHQHTDPRRFNFAIVCMNCGNKFATLQEARGHFLRTCPSGLLVDVLCGHCELRTSSWPSMCQHLNRAGMQRQPPCKAEYRMVPPAKPGFPAAPQPQIDSLAHSHGRGWSGPRRTEKPPMAEPAASDTFSLQGGS